MKTATIGLIAALLISACSSVPQTLHLVERATTDVVTDTGATGDSVGDILTFANQLYDAANENPIGTDNGYCLRTVVASSWECNWTITLEEGQITVEGPFYDAADSILAVTGGTGDYKNVRGAMQLKARNPEGTEFDFIYELYRY